MSQGKYNDPANLHLTVELKLPGVFQNKRHLAKSQTVVFFFFFFPCVELRNITSTAATLCFQPLLRPCDSSSAVGRVEEKGNYSPLFHFLWCPLEKLCSVWKAPAETQPAGAQHTVGIFFFSFPAVSSTEMQGFFFAAWPVFVFRTCEQKTFSRRVGQMETINGLEWRRRSMQAGRHSDGSTESYWSHWLVQPWS